MLDLALVAALGKASSGLGGPPIRISSKLQKKQALEIFFLSHSACTCYPDSDKGCERNLQGLRGKEEGKELDR